MLLHHLSKKYDWLSSLNCSFRKAVDETVDCKTAVRDSVSQAADRAMKFDVLIRVIISILISSFLPLTTTTSFQVGKPNHTMSPRNSHTTQNELLSSTDTSTRTTVVAAQEEEEEEEEEEAFFNVVHQSGSATYSNDLQILEQTFPGNGTSTKTTTTTTKILYCVRHGSSVSNEWMQIPENSWGAPTFCDDWNMKDARLSETGIRQAQDMCQRLVSHPQKLQLDKIELVLVSPLTRCLQTYRYGVAPALRAQNPNPIPVLAMPVLTERVYTVSETGRPVEELAQEFPEMDWTMWSKLLFLVEENQQPPQQQPWWFDPSVPTEFHPSIDIEYPEWRPHGNGQRYQVAGEPMSVFTKRMHALRQFISNRPERHILCIAHWGVFRFLSGGIEMENCQVTRIELQPPPSHQQQQQHPGDRNNPTSDSD
jgi:broad specificity phosphatase PhoE